MRLDAGQSLDRLEAVAPPLFFKAAKVAQWVVFPAALLWLTWLLFRLHKAQQEWNAWLPRMIPGDAAVLHFSFLCFLTADLVGVAEKLLAETAEHRRKQSLRQQEQSRWERFQTEIRHYIQTLAELGQASPCDEEWLGAAAMADLEEMAARCRQAVERHQGQIEMERQAAQKRERQIHWLESEFATVPASKRPEVADAWALYEQACVTGDPGKKLETLKAARKLLPKEFRGD